jgi:hypothetical protein
MSTTIYPNSNPNHIPAKRALADIADIADLEPLQQTACVEHVLASRAALLRQLAVAASDVVANDALGLALGRLFSVSTMNASKSLEVLNFNRVSQRMVLAVWSVCSRTSEHLFGQVCAHSEHRLATFVASRESVLWIMRYDLRSQTISRTQV